MGAVSLTAFQPSSVMAALAASDRYREAIGIQLYTLRNEIAKDVTGTLR